MAVMTIDHKLQVLQSYTNNLDLLHKAIDRATKSEVKDFTADTALVQKQLEEVLGPNTTGARSPGEQVSNMQESLASQGRSASGTDLAAAAMAQVVLQMLETQRDGAAKEGGRIGIAALLDHVVAQYRLPVT